EGVRYIAAHVRHLVLPAVDAQFQIHIAIALPRVAGVGKGAIVEVLARHHFADEETQKPHHQTDDAKAQHEAEEGGDLRQQAGKHPRPPCRGRRKSHSGFRSSSFIIARCRKECNGYLQERRLKNGENSKSAASRVGDGAWLCWLTWRRRCAR